jgi:hypothetical protein
VTVDQNRLRAFNVTINSYYRRLSRQPRVVSNSDSFFQHDLNLGERPQDVEDVGTIKWQRISRYKPTNVARVVAFAENGPAYRGTVALSPLAPSATSSLGQNSLHFGEPSCRAQDNMFATEN